MGGGMEENHKSFQLAILCSSSLKNYELLDYSDLIHIYQRTSLQNRCSTKCELESVELGMNIEPAHYPLFWFLGILPPINFAIYSPINLCKSLL